MQNVINIIDFKFYCVKDTASNKREEFDEYG